MAEGRKKVQEHATLYRAYRPRSWSEVRGQPQVVSSFEAALKHPKKMAHAYLFAGSRGTGKTSVARILAQSLGVSEKDLYEIDAASNRGIDDIRALREGVYALPFDSPYKFYIVDEAHMLTRDAWNALLKTLEEPPAHAMFVLATTEPDKVPETILSRTQVHHFKQPAQATIADIVIDVAKKEGFGVERPAAELIALLAEGSFRDALSILQKILASASGKEIRVDLVERVTNAPRMELVRSVLTEVASGNPGGALAAIQHAANENFDMRIFAKLLIGRLRIALLARYAPQLAEELSRDLNEFDRDAVSELAKKTAVNSDMLRRFLEAYAGMAYAALPHLPLELAVIDICSR